MVFWVPLSKWPSAKHTVGAQALLHEKKFKHFVGDVPKWSSGWGTSGLANVLPAQGLLQYVSPHPPPPPWELYSLHQHP